MQTVIKAPWTPLATRALESKAAEFESLVLHHACDDKGIVRTHLFYDGFRPVRDEDFAKPPDFRVSGVSPSAFIPYEDAGMTTGAMLAGLSLKARLTGDPKSVRNAGAMYEAIRAIYKLGETQEPGYFPKPYGGRNSTHFSRDQYLFAMNGLWAYYPIASDEQRQEVRDMVAAMADFWIRRNYCSNYFNIQASSHLLDYMGPLFLGIVGIACKLSGEDRFFEEYLRLAYDQNLIERMPETLFSLYRMGVKYDGGTYLRQNEHAIMMKVLALDLLWEFDLPHGPLWRRTLEQFWREEIPTGVDLSDGLQYHFLRYDQETDKAYLTEPGRIFELENPLNYAELNWGGLRKRTGSVQSAYSAFIAADRLNLPEAAEFGAKILGKLEVASFRGIHVPDESHIPPGKEFEPLLIRTGYTAMWVWAYWMARSRSRAKE